MTTEDKIIIAGPCSAETEEQLQTTATQLARTAKVSYFRAGIWKPRTVPGGFEGVGTIGLSWLLNVKKHTGLKTATEVATAKHVEDALQFRTDLLWIGARTTVNPFSVQEIASALRGTEVQVLVKNPLNPDLKLWAGAVERLQKCSVKNIGLIHRGFSAYGISDYRNSPLWELVIEMKRNFQELKMICDPSHICGSRERLQEVSQRGLDLGFDGLMIESHCNPDLALTDKQQQLTPDDFQKLLGNLVFKKQNASEPGYAQSLQTLRERISNLDQQLVALLGARMNVSKEIGQLKMSHNITLLQPSRYEDVVRMHVNAGKKNGLSEEFIHAYLSSLHMESIRIQEQLT